MSAGRDWKCIPMGGSSMVVSTTDLPRNDTRIPPVAYDASQGYSVGYPFIEDDGRIRWDFVCFSHDDARLIAAAPEMLETLRVTLGNIRSLKASCNCTTYDMWIEVVEQVIAKAMGVA